MIDGKCVKFGDSVNTDIVMPGRYLVSIDPLELAKHVFEPLGEGVQKRVYESRIVVAGENFGCGSAREQAASGLVGAGVQAVVAKSFARTFYRNAINCGLPAVECPEAVECIDDGATASIDVIAGTVTVGDKVCHFTPFPENLQRILDAGGLIPFVISQIHDEGK